jgi:hypothetical protein
MPAKGPHATTTDLEHGNRDAITPSASSSLTPDGPRSKAATPTPRRSLEIEDAVPRHQTSQAQRIWTKIEARLPAPIARYGDEAVAWLKGPEPPRTYRITPFLERSQTFPVRMLARLPQWSRACIYIVAFVVWAVLFGVILTNYSITTNFAGFGPPVPLSCVTTLWYISTLKPSSISTDYPQAKCPVLRTERPKLLPLR